MTAATVWNGRRGAVILGPTEHRVARWLADRCRGGRVTIRNSDLVAALNLERSEGYRITARLRVLGLFGIENDRAGTHGGRRVWRTAVEHDGPGLDRARHREAWSRIVGWARARRQRVTARLAAIRRHGAGTAAATVSPAAVPPAAGETFAARMRRHGLGRLLDQWRIVDDA